MKKNVIVFGLISGLLVTSFMIWSISVGYNSGDFDNGQVIGYTAMIVAFSFIFVGIKNFRDKHNNGVVTFGKAFKIGLYISLIASTIYVVAWMVDYYVFVPDFMDKYTEYALNKAKVDGATQVELDKKAAEMEGFKEMYKNPLLIVLFTYIEILPIGLIISVISALILKRRSKDHSPVPANM